MTGTATDQGGTRGSGDPGGARGAGGAAGSGGAAHRRTPSRAPKPTSDTLRAARRRAVGVLATVVSVITTIVVLVLAVHVVFVAFEANVSNDLVRTVGDWARSLAWQFKDVFQPSDHKIEVAVNYGLAALVYLIVGRVVVGLIRRLG